VSHPDAQTLSHAFAQNLRIIEMQTDGLSHEDSLLQLPFRGNCLNWVLGHMVAGRNSALVLLDEPSLWSAADMSRYQTGSEAITRNEQALPLERLLADLSEAQRRIETALATASVDELAGPISFRGQEVPLAQALDGLHWHETYHLGQLELLRQLAGTDDAVI
jgi:hypothetical protein